MAMTEYLESYTGVDAATIFGSKPPLATVLMDGEGRVTIGTWNFPNLAAPTADMIAAALAAPTKVSAAVLIAHAAAVRDAKIASGITVNTAPVGDAPDLFLVDTNDSGRINILGLQALAAAGQKPVWVQSTSLVNLTPGQLNALAVSAGLYVQDCYQSYGAVVGGALANPPSITVMSDVDAASWPSTTVNFPVPAGT